MLSIGKVAKRAGISVRSLRHWERLGLIHATRSEAGQRFFSTAQLIRLHQAVVLRRMGFALADIARMLDSKTLDGKAVMAMQRDMLTTQRLQLDHAIASLDTAINATISEDALTPAALCHFIKMGESTMNDEGWQKVYDKYYTPEEQAKWTAIKDQIPDSVARAAERAWPPLIAQIEELIAEHADPAGDAAQACLAEWQRLLKPLTDADPSALEASRAMWDDMDNWPEGAPEPPFSRAVWDFVMAAKAATP